MPPNANSCKYCFIDIDVNNYRSKLGLAASFVYATDSRYGFSSKDLRKLGGSELSRIDELMSSDHEWCDKKSDGIEVRPPVFGNRIVIKLFWDVAPLACENFATLCTNGNNTISGNGDQKKTPKPPPIGESGKPLTYKDSIIHRVVKRFIVQGGDFVFGNGSGGESVYNGKKFKDERAGLGLKHNRRGIVSMGNSGKNSNTSQFFITFDKASQCDGKHVIFGEVVSGFDTLDALEDVGTESGEPLATLRIIDCGAWHPMTTAGQGFWYDQIDNESFTGKNPVFMVRPRVAIVAPGAVCEKFAKLLGSHFSTMSIAIDSVPDVIKMVHNLLEVFTIDVVVIAPVNKEIFQSFELPACWNELSIERDSVLLSVKPIDASSAIWNNSWIGKEPSMRLDGSA